ncbi:uncharacterized protein DMAD_08174 [Drosophila madeirensis]|uniref:Uncharacterized protein n=1 Tax=Drosophila madeirensis TaxID=30013 RepID=A0AAU9ER88_DROMD
MCPLKEIRFPVTPLYDLNIVDGPLLQLINEDLPWLKNETLPPYYNLTLGGFESLLGTFVCTATQTMSECSQASKSTQTCFNVPQTWNPEPAQASNYHIMEDIRSYIQPKLKRNIGHCLADIVVIIALAYTFHDVLCAAPISWLKEKITQLFPAM